MESLSVLEQVPPTYIQHVSMALYKTCKVSLKNFPLPSARAVRCTKFYRTICNKMSPELGRLQGGAWIERNRLLCERGTNGRVFTTFLQVNRYRKPRRTVALPKVVPNGARNLRLEERTSGCLTDLTSRTGQADSVLTFAAINVSA